MLNGYSDSLFGFQHESGSVRK